MRKKTLFMYTSREKAKSGLFGAVRANPHATIKQTDYSLEFPTGESWVFAFPHSDGKYKICGMQLHSIWADADVEYEHLRHAIAQIRYFPGRD